MMTRRIYFVIVATLCLVIASLGVWLWYLEPEEGFRWATKILLIPATWGALSLLRWLSSPLAAKDADAAVQQSLQQAHNLVFGTMIGLGLVMATEMASSLAVALAFIDTAFQVQLSARVEGIVWGAMIVIFGNFLPKMLTPISIVPCHAKKQSLQRFNGWTIVIAGFGYGAAWVVFSLETADFVSTLALIAGMALVVARLVWTIVTCRRPTPPAVSS